MITKQRAQILADSYNMEVVDVETLHDAEKIGCIADYIKLKLKDEKAEYKVDVYLGSDYKVTNNKEFYIESKIKNALYSLQ